MVKAYAYSPSRLSVYQRCARQYYYHYVIKLPTRQQAAASVGISLHGALEAVQQAGGVEATGLDGALALLLARWESEGFADAVEEAEAKKQAEQLLEGYLKRFGTGPGKPVLVEKKLEADFEGVPFLGIVDRVDRLPDGRLELIDYKSGAMREPTPAVRQQMAIYRHLIRAQLGEFPALVSIHHLAANTRVAIDLTPSDWQSTLEHAASSARAIECDQDFTPAVGAACRHCDFSHRCVAFQRSSREAADHLDG